MNKHTLSRESSPVVLQMKTWKTESLQSVPHLILIPKYEASLI